MKRYIHANNVANFIDKIDVILIVDDARDEVMHDLPNKTNLT